MGKMGLLSMLGVTALSAYVFVELQSPPPLPELQPEPWWGAGEPQKLDETVREFVIDIPQKDVDDLSRRLTEDFRVTPSLDDAAFTYGMNSATLQHVLTHWRHDYHWRERQQRLDVVKHYKTNIEGLEVHYMRMSPVSTPTARGKTVRPLLLLHGWPGSFVEFFDILPYLTIPSETSDVVFDVIVPSIPGYGFSESPKKSGFDTLAAARLFIELMERLDFDKFYVQGGDWGSIIASNMAIVFPEKLLGVHINMVPLSGGLNNLKIILGAWLPSGWIMEPQLEKYWYPLSNFYGHFLQETGYFYIQATKPDTIGVALNTSPQGLAAYILEKFSTFTDKNNKFKKDGGLLEAAFPISLDKMLDNICIYWFTGSIATSMRFYKENVRGIAKNLLNRIPTSVPAGLLLMPHEFMYVPRHMAAGKFSDIVTYTTQDVGGHFAAMENPAMVAQDIHAFVTAVERRGTK